MIFINGQWQGGGEISTLYGAHEIEKLCSNGMNDVEIIKIEIDHNTQLKKQRGIIGYEAILKQTTAAKDLLNECRPDSLFTIGGGCDADVASIAYLNERCKGDLTVFWFDAHGDLNSPQESESGLFYGMPSRVLIHPVYGFIPLIPVPVKKENYVQVGGRDFDPGEKVFIDRNEICYFNIYQAAGDAIEKYVLSRSGRPAYIHFDLDVLDPQEFSATPLPVPEGMGIRQTMEIMQIIKENMKLVGLGLFEYKPGEDENHVIQSVIDFSRNLV